MSVSTAGLAALSPETRRWVELQAWLPDLTSRDSTKKRIAAQRVCELAWPDEKIAKAIMLLWSDGVLSQPPAWPLVDIVPVGGGVGLITCAVRSMINGRRREVKLGIPLKKPGQHGDALREAIDRGKFELRARYA